MPVSTEDARKVEDHISRTFSADDARGRAEAIRRLFVEVLDFDADTGQISLAAAPASVTLPETAWRVAQLDGVKVLYIGLDTPETDRVRKAEASASARLIADQLSSEDLLLAFTNTSADQLHLIWPDLEPARPSLRRMTVERDLPRRTAAEQLAGIYSKRDKRPIRVAIRDAFDVEPVTKEFFAEYKRLFEAAKQAVTGFDPSSEEGTTLEEREERADENLHLFVQTLFNRLLFVYFLSRKGWLTFKGDNDYLNALWKDYQESAEETNFYRDRLCHLFFFGLNNPQSSDLNFRDRFIETRIGRPPFLNGGLFEQTALDRRKNVDVPDETIKPVLKDLFDKFNFTVMESTPFDVEVAVDPEMLGKVFEELVTGRNESGSYYTPRTVVSFMCRESLKGHLETRDTGLTSDVIAGLVDEHRTASIDVAAARRVAQALGEVTVVDPACGSGAYLLGMMQELVELQTVLFNAGADAKSLHDLKLEIIERNLYGADIDEFAINIAMLRLWLSLAIEDQPPIEPLPNLNFKVVKGDSLLGPDPGPGNYGDLFQARAHGVAAELAAQKQRFMSATTGKDEIKEAVQQLEDDLRDALADVAAPPGAVDWRVTFAEVFDRGGFDIAVANPPYIQLQKEGGKLANAYRACGYETFARTGDIYQLFYERGCQLLKAKGGLLAYITSNSWLRAEYGKLTRRYFTESHAPLRWLDLGKDVFASAIVDSGVLLLRTGGGQGSPFPAVDMDRLPAKTAIPPAKALWGETRPEGNLPWSVLSQAEWAVMDKMHSTGTPLRDWDIAINYGIKTGLNEAFIIDNETKDALVAEDPRSAAVLERVLRGKDIQRYQAKWAGMWLINTHNGYDNVPPVEVDDYPAIKAFLDRHYEKLSKRQDRGRTPYNLRNCAYDATISVTALTTRISRDKSCSGLNWSSVGGSPTTRADSIPRRLPSL